MDISNVDVCVQFGITNHLTLESVWQRLGRAARDQGREGIVVLILQKYYLLPNPPEKYFLLERLPPPSTLWQLDPTNNSDSPNFYLPVTIALEAEVQTNLQRINKLKAMGHASEKHTRDQDRVHKTQPGIGRRSTRESQDERRARPDPALAWLINTIGCRQRIVMALFQDPDTFNVSDGTCGKLKCDSCSFPTREVYNRLALPSGLTVMPPPTLPGSQRQSQTFDDEVA